MCRSYIPITEAAEESIRLMHEAYPDMVISLLVLYLQTEQGWTELLQLVHQLS